MHCKHIWKSNVSWQHWDFLHITPETLLHWQCWSSPSFVVSVQCILVCKKHCMLQQLQLLCWWKCSLLACALLDYAIAALLSFYHRGAACGALESSPVPVGRLKHPTKLQSWQGRGKFSWGPSGSGWHWYNSRCHWKLLDWAVGWDFLFNVQKTVFSPSYLWLFQSQWGSCVSRKSICLPPGHQI